MMFSLNGLAPFLTNSDTRDEFYVEISIEEGSNLLLLCKAVCALLKYLCHLSPTERCDKLFTGPIVIKLRGSMVSLLKTLTKVTIVSLDEAAKLYTGHHYYSDLGT